MAKIGNEARLILKLAEVRMRDSKRLEQEYRLGGDPSESYPWPEAMKAGYYAAVDEYRQILNNIVVELEEK